MGILTYKPNTKFCKMNKIKKIKSPTIKSTTKKIIVPNGVIPVIHNIVAHVYLNCKVNLKEMAAHCHCVEYNPKNFSGAVMRFVSPKGTVVLFENGKVVLCGNKTEKNLRFNAKVVSNILKKIGCNPKYDLNKLVPSNYVATADVRFPVSLEGINDSYSEYTAYEPTIFRGVMKKLLFDDFNANILIYRSGKFLISGV